MRLFILSRTFRGHALPGGTGVRSTLRVRGLCSEATSNLGDSSSPSSWSSRDRRLQRGRRRGRSQLISDTKQPRWPPSATSRLLDDAEPVPSEPWTSIRCPRLLTLQSKSPLLTRSDARLAPWTYIRLVRGLGGSRGRSHETSRVVRRSNELVRIPPPRSPISCTVPGLRTAV